MIRHIKVSNFGLFRSALLEPAQAFTVITGTTGSGKSILFDAISLLFEANNRRDPHPFAPEEPSTIELACTNKKNVYVFRRINLVSNIYYLNNTRSTKKHIRSFLKKHIALSHQMSTIWSTVTHTHLLLPILGEGLLIKKVDDAFVQWESQKQHIQQIEKILSTPTQSKEYLKASIEELENAQFNEHSEEKLLEEQRRLMEHGRLTSLQESLSPIYPLSTEMHTLMQKAISRLDAAKHLLPDTMVHSLENASQQMREAFSTLTNETQALEESTLQNADLDQALSTCNAQLNLLQYLSNKHAVEPQDLPKKLRELKEFLARIDCLDADLIKAYDQLSTLQDTLLSLSHNLSTQCLEKSTPWINAVQKVLKSVDMHDCHITIEAKNLPEEQWSPQGTKSLTLLIQTNNRSEALPPHQILSGGELARFSLAFQAASIEKAPYKILFFDEVEAGLSPAVCLQVGKVLKRLSQEHQIIAITHSPHIACFADKHFLVTKTKSNSTYTSHLKELRHEECRIQELIRMLSGDAPDNQHAKELILDLLKKRGL